MHRFLRFIAVFLFALSPLSAQQQNSAQKPAATAKEDNGILPDSFAGWTLATRTVFTPIEAASPAAGGATAAATAEYGFASGEEGEYTRGSETLQAQVYRMKDPSGAYGEYSYLRTPDMPRANLAAHSSMSPDRALVLSGNLVLDIRGRGLPSLEPQLKSLAAAVSKHAEMGAGPTLWQYLPAEGMVARSDHYILGPAALDQFFPVALGDSLGFSNGAEAELANYRLDGRDLTLLIADFPTPGLAANQLAELQKRFNVNGSHAGQNFPALYAKRSLTLLVIVSGASSEAQADALLDRVRSTTQFTWDEPTSPYTLRGFVPIPVIASLIAGTCIICMFAAVASIAFGGFRLLVKRLLPDRVFDRSSTLQILQLGLSSKPINAEDFYGVDRSRERK
ncbi:MAG: DUF6599 family protein [Candidatus Acidiferrales bacterium]